MDYGEHSSLDALTKLPHGTFYGEDLLDDGRKIQVDVTINEKEFIVDLRNNPEQDAGPNNASQMEQLFQHKWHSKVLPQVILFVRRNF